MITLASPNQVTNEVASRHYLETSDGRPASPALRSSWEDRAGVADEGGPIAPERALAAGVLRQAAADLRRLRESKDAIGREMFSDARAWFVSNDREWLYSFHNVCEALGLSPDDVREEVFADARSGWVSHSRRVALATATRLVGSLSTLFLPRPTGALAIRHS